MIVAIALSVLIIVTFQYLFPAPKQAHGPVRTQEGAAAVKEKQGEGIQIVAPEPPAEEKELTVSADKYIVTFSDIGGAVKKIELKNYKKLKSNEPLGITSSTGKTTRS